MIDYLVLFFLTAGTIFIFIASIGLLKMPDAFLRMSASTIAGTFGVASTLVACALYFWDFSTALHIAGVILFLILTVPISAHMLGRAAHIINLKKWDKTVCDDMKGKFDENCRAYRGMSDKCK
jgi:multicomponent Na+:H+ antiporter subunit G